MLYTIHCWSNWYVKVRLQGGSPTLGLDWESTAQNGVDGQCRTSLLSLTAGTRLNLNLISGVAYSDSNLLTGLSVFRWMLCICYCYSESNLLTGLSVLGGSFVVYVFVTVIPINWRGFSVLRWILCMFTNYCWPRTDKSSVCLSFCYCHCDFNLLKFSWMLL